MEPDIPTAGQILHTSVMKPWFYLFTLIININICLPGQVCASPSNDPAVNDQPLEEPLALPDWFKVSFLDIQEDITEANKDGRGLIIYFGQEYCPYCKAHLTNNWGRKDIVAYTRANFDVIGINTRGDRTVTDVDGKQYTEKTFAAQYKANFTPTVLFIDKHGKTALKLSGYRPPYQFRAALEYVADVHHEKEIFRNYLARAEGAESYGQDALNENPIFSPPPYQLNKLLKAKPLVVFFEEKKCHACDILHASPLSRDDIRKLFTGMNAVQLDMWSDTPVITPAGKSTTAKAWADELALDYAPTLIFYDESGKEIIRVDSVVGFYRLRSVLRYVDTRAYRKQPSYQIWRIENSEKPGH